MPDITASTLRGAYPTRIACFVDVLGFSRDVLEIERRPGLFLSVDAVLRHVWMCKRDLDKARQTKGVNFDARMSQFSDCLVTSYLPETGAVFRALADAAFLGHVMLRAGYLPRGAITLGRLHHDDVVVFGQGLIEAVELEKDQVDTPRILVTDSVMGLLRGELATADLTELEPAYIRDMGNGPFVHILGPEWPFLKKERVQEKAGELHGDGIRELYEELRAGLPLRHQNAPHERARRKIEWLCDYINSTVAEEGYPDGWRCELPGRS